MLTLFISHAWDDKVQPQFGDLYTELEGYELWIDKTNIPPGKDIRANIAEGIKQADLVILLWSAAAAASADVQYEMQTAVAEGKDIIPCLLDDTPFDKMPILEGRLYVDLRTTSAGVLGWMRLRYFLTEFFIAKYESRLMNVSDDAEKEERATMLTSLKTKQATVQMQIAFLQDTAFRIDAGAPDRDQKNPYLLNMVKSIEANMTRDGSASALQLQEFMTFIQEVFVRLPNDDPTTLKFRNTLFRVKLSELDPDGSNSRLGIIKAMLN